ncbi:MULTISPECIES: Hsp20/alpha crystallin family protein [unclassified Oceanispirochaeta]|uniref:Hsp20/alpha crystallin family protein n=1 Tax=unclassified Oceanispirochaeta TaxID=2635722 RepID=UPI000E098858|nr:MULTISPECIES: Hsp20/alpha crystallin family protein [unclassified Oceanispirochaeta]MBF9018520.1 Hsp20/alpha crystallin family protein [Oceanispirochaeta sp. M2]NPD74927.1 Hsp20/alpha crystallin family protein [Oceanispirochaeta sp. M1]RDG29209.1 Hsp20/alpha crystallin family protein [Oceanispirochaeta sp. M1]
MALVKWKNRSLNDPWEEMRSLQNEINDLFSDNRIPTTTGLFDRSVAPSIDFIEGENEFTLSCELPGLEEKDIDVSIASNILTIKGNKKSEEEHKEGKYYKKETWSGSFQRTITLPQTVDNEKISAEMRNGILQVMLPKKEESKPKQIAVKIQ